MRKKYLVAFLVIMNLGAFAQDVNIPDSNFLSKLKSLGVDENNDGKIQAWEAEKVTSLSMKYSYIEDLTGIEAFKNLTNLNCSHNSLINLDLSQNTALEELYCSYLYNITNLDLSNNTALLKVISTNTPLVSVNVKKCVKLTYVWFHVNELTNIDLTNNIALETFACQNNKLTSIDLTNNINLKDLRLDGNNITSVDLTKNIVLEEVHFYANKLTTLDLGDKPNLIELSCVKNQLTNLNVINSISLTHLECYQNNLSGLNLSTNIELVDLDCGFNKLTTLDISQNTKLINFACSNNELTTLEIDKNTALDLLSCSNNLITNLNLSQNTTLTSLSCSNNKLTTLDLSNNLNLDYLFCGNNLFTSLDITKNVMLTTFGCSNSQLTSIDFSESFRIRTLHLSDNQFFEFLDISPIKYLYQFNAKNCLNLKCLSEIPKFTDIIDLDSTAIECVKNIPDGIQKELANMPICNPINNKYGCQTYPYVAGNVYVDTDLNEKKNIDEKGYQGVKITSLPDSNSFYTDQFGNYLVSLKDTGLYTLNIEAPLYYNAVPTKINGYTTSFLEVDTHTVALQVKEDAKDLVVSISSFTRARSGFKMRYYLSYWNKGTEIVEDAIIKFVMPSAFVLEDSSSVSNIIGDTLVYNIGKLVLGESGQISIHGKTKLETLDLKQKVIASIYNIDELIGDYTPTNNHDTINYIITGSYDPNDKLGIEKISPKEVEKGTVLDYRIRFQNTGTDTAFTVIVVDTLSPFLDLSTLKITSNSHTMKSELKGNVLIMTFDNILLPDSNVNELKSHGYIYYQVQPLKTLNLGDQILNTANIYFDFNSPIITNTTVTTVQDPVITYQTTIVESSNILVYPNPTNGVLFIDGDFTTYHVFTINGLSIQKGKINENIDISSLPKGTYLLELSTDKKTIVKKINKI